MMASTPRDDGAVTGLAADFHQLFAGSSLRHGTYIDLQLVDGKMEMKDEKRGGGRELRGGASVHDWRVHLSGDRSVGVSPVEDGKARWGVIDVDTYGRSIFIDLADRVSDLKLPLVVCRSKSGGAHLFLFASNWVPIAELNAALVRLAGVLGIAKRCDFFPPSGGEGNWVNMPYFGGHESERYAVNKGRLHLTPGEFLALAYDRTVDVDALMQVGRASGPATSRAADLEDATDRLDYWFRRVSDAAGANANNSLAAAAFDLGRYCRDAELDPEKARARLMEAWAKRKPHEPHEFDQVWNRCLASGIAKGRPARIAEGDSLPEFERMIRERDGDHTAIIAQIEGVAIRFEKVADLTDQRKFNDIVAGAIGRIYDFPKDRNVWVRHLREPLESAEVEIIGGGVSEQDEFRELVNEFANDRWRGEVKEDLLMDRPWLDEETKRHYFKMSALVGFLRRSNSRFAQDTRRALGRRIRLLSGGPQSTTIKGVTVDLFWVPQSRLPGATPQLDLPTLPPSAI